MSKTRYVEYRDQGFYVYDVSLGIFLKYLIDAAEASDQAKAPWLAPLISWWRVVACVDPYGLRLDEYKDWTTEQRLTFVALIEEACTTIQKRASIPGREMMDWRVLDEQGIFPRGATEVPTAPVVELGQAVIALLSGSLLEPPKGKQWFYGTPSGRDEIKVVE